MSAESVGPARPLSIPILRFFSDLTNDFVYGRIRFHREVRAGLKVFSFDPVNDKLVWELIQCARQPDQNWCGYEAGLI